MSAAPDLPRGARAQPRIAAASTEDAGRSLADSPSAVPRRQPGGAW